MSPPLKYKTPEEEKQKEMMSIVRGVLAEDYWELSVDKLFIEEDLLERLTRVKCIVKLNEESLTIEEVGRGPIDALFNGLKDGFKESYLSLNGLAFYSFSIEGDVGDSSPDAATAVEAALSIASDSNYFPLIYRHKDASINRAAITAVLNAVEYYINSERAMKKLHARAADARERNRGDILNECILKMTPLLEGVSYSRVLDSPTE